MGKKKGSREGRRDPRGWPSIKTWPVLGDGFRPCPKIWWPSPMGLEHKHKLWLEHKLIEAELVCGDVVVAR